MSPYADRWEGVEVDELLCPISKLKIRLKFGENGILRLGRPASPL
jgi:hypothetical protein